MRQNVKELKENMEVYEDQKNKWSTTYKFSESVYSRIWP